jgi:hypothetical protein
VHLRLHLPAPTSFSRSARGFEGLMGPACMNVTHITSCNALNKPLQASADARALENLHSSYCRSVSACCICNSWGIKQRVGPKTWLRLEEKAADIEQLLFESLHTAGNMENKAHLPALGSLSAAALTERLATDGITCLLAPTRRAARLARWDATDGNGGKGTSQRMAAPFAKLDDRWRFWTAHLQSLPLPLLATKACRGLLEEQSAGDVKCATLQ